MSICSDKTSTAVWRRYVCDQLAASDLPKGWLQGLTTSNGTDGDHDIDIAAGSCRDAADSVTLVNAATLVKQIDANWAAGSNAGGFPSGLTLTADTWYYVFLIGSSDGTLVDAGFDTSLTASNLLTDAAGYSVYRRIGAVLTDGSSNILAYNQIGNTFTWDTPVEDYGQAMSTTAALFTTTTPTGFKHVVFGHALVVSSAGSTRHMRLSDPDLSDVAVSASANATAMSSDTSSGYSNGSRFEVVCNTSAQLRIRSNGTTTGRVSVHGWIDPFDGFTVSGNSKGSAELFVNGTPVSLTTQTAIDFSIPSGVSEFKVGFSAVSSNSTSPWIFQLGDAGGIETSGYSGMGVTNTTYNRSTAGAVVSASVAATWSVHGTITFTLVNGATNLWSISGCLGHSESDRFELTGYSKALSGELTTVRLTTIAGTDQFDAGTINVQYDNPDERTVVTNTITNTFEGAEPAGVIHAWAGTSAPSGYLECDGSAVSRTTYADLYANIGVRFGTGDGSTTFNIPDLRGQFIRGYDNGAGTDPDAASRTDSGDGTTGDNVGTQQPNDVQAHTHVFKYTGTGRANGGANVMRQVEASNWNVNYQGGSTPTGNETRPTNVSMMYIIKT